MFKIFLLIVFASGGVGLAEDPLNQSFQTRAECEAKMSASASKAQEILDSDPRTRGGAKVRGTRCFSEKEMEDLSKQRRANEEPIGEKVD